MDECICAYKTIGSTSQRVQNPNIPILAGALPFLIDSILTTPECYLIRGGSTKSKLDHQRMHSEFSGFVWFYLA